MQQVDVDVQQIYVTLCAGGLALVPTDVGYGLVALEEEAVRKIYELKGRPAAKPCVTVGNAEILALLGAIPAKIYPEQEGTTMASRMVVGRDTMRNRPAITEEFRKAGLDGDSSKWTPKQQAHAQKIRLAGMAMYRVDRWRQLRSFYSASAGAAAGRTVPAKYDFTPAIAAHRCRVWVLIGDHDYVDYGLPEHRRWTAEVPNAKLAEFRDAGHVLWLDDPDLFRKTLLEALGDGAECRPAS